jgi:hypothetical protein
MGLKFFYSDPGSGIFLTLDPGCKNLDPGSGMEKFGSRIRDKQSGYTTLFYKSAYFREKKLFHVKTLIPRLFLFS